MKKIMQQAIGYVQQAGELVRSQLADMQVEEKGFGNYVTNIDLAVQRQLHEDFSALVPGSVLISEENETNDYATRQPRWIIDPIDGTTNLIHRYPHVAISAAYIETRGRFGIVYNPFNRELFTAMSGHGAYLNGERIAVSGNRTLGSSLIGFGLPYDRSKSGRMFQAAEQVYAHCQDMKRKGPASLDLAYVAAGRIDGYMEQDLHIWDIAAGLIVLAEAGGAATDWTGEQLPDGLSITDLAATNGHIHDELMGILLRTSS